MNALDVLRQSLGFFQSMVRSGEPVTETFLAQEIDADIALARVEAVVKAAREAANPMTPDGRAAEFMWGPANRALIAALRALDAGPTEERTDG